MVTTGAIRRAKLQSNHHHQQTNTQLLQAGCASCHPTNSVKALEGKYPATYILYDKHINTQTERERDERPVLVTSE